MQHQNLLIGFFVLVGLSALVYFYGMKYQAHVGKVVLDKSPIAILLDEPNPFQPSITVPKGKSVLLAINDKDKLFKALQLISK